jgi:hypothetical protein
VRKIVWILGPVALIALLAMAVFAARGPSATTAFTLKSGTCFDVPGDAQVGDIPTIDCTKPHDAEVFAAFNVGGADATANPPYPGESPIGSEVGNRCGPADQRAYAGQTASASLAVGYFFPDQNAWDRGERQVTCYLHTRDGSKLSAPLGTGANGAANPS